MARAIGKGSVKNDPNREPIQVTTKRGIKTTVYRSVGAKASTDSSVGSDSSSVCSDMSDSEDYDYLNGVDVTEDDMDDFDLSMRERMQEKLSDNIDEYCPPSSDIDDDDRYAMTIDELRPFEYDELEAKAVRDLFSDDPDMETIATYHDNEHMRKYAAQFGAQSSLQALTDDKSESVRAEVAKRIDDTSLMKNDPSRDVQHILRKRAEDPYNQWREDSQPAPAPEPAPAKPNGINNLGLRPDEARDGVDDAMKEELNGIVNEMAYTGINPWFDNDDYDSLEDFMNYGIGEEKDAFNEELLNCAIYNRGSEKFFMAHPDVSYRRAFAEERADEEEFAEVLKNDEDPQVRAYVAKWYPEQFTNDPSELVQKVVKENI